jgi:hypothetical protein
VQCPVGGYDVAGVIDRWLRTTLLSHRKGASLVTTTVRGNVRKGWKVYLGSDEVGRVADVGPAEVVIERGALLKHTVHMPADCIDEAADGIVDLRSDDRTRRLLDAS